MAGNPKIICVRGMAYMVYIDMGEDFLPSERLTYPFLDMIPEETEEEIEE